MINTEELRRKVNSTDIVDHIDLHANIRPFLSELLDRLEAAEKERDDVAQQLVQSEIGKREISEAHNTVTRRLSVLADENAALRSKIAGMEKQEPVGEIQRANSTGNYICSEVWVPLPVGSKLYALPGAKGEEK